MKKDRRKVYKTVMMMVRMRKDDYRSDDVDGLKVGGENDAPRQDAGVKDRWVVRQGTAGWGRGRKVGTDADTQGGGKGGGGVVVRPWCCRVKSPQQAPRQVRRRARS